MKKTIIITKKTTKKKNKISCTIFEVLYPSGALVGVVDVIVAGC